jgi:hypothetical protein
MICFQNGSVPKFILFINYKETEGKPKFSGICILVSELFPFDINMLIPINFQSVNTQIVSLHHMKIFWGKSLLIYLML